MRKRLSPFSMALAMMPLATILNLTALKAQESDTATRQLDPLLITANKYLQKQSTTGKVVTVITRPQIDAYAGRTLAQLLNEQAGLTLSGSLNAPGTPVTLFGRGAGSGRTLLLIDGMPVNDPSNITGEYDLNLLSLSQVEQIEVCRGAQSTLYGSDAIGGVVNLITKKNTNRKAGAEISALGGSQGTFRGDVRLYGKTGKWQYQAAVTQLHTDGFSAAHDSTGTSNYDRDGMEATQMQVALSYALSSQLRLKSFLQTGRYRADADAGVFTDEKDFIIRNTSLHGGGGFEFVNEKITVQGKFMYSRLSRNYTNDSLDIPSFIRFSYNNYEAITRFADMYASIPLGHGFTLLQGADFRNASFHQQYRSTSSFGPYNSEFKDTGMSQLSMYASLNFASPKARLFTELGGRINVHSRFGAITTYTFHPSYQLGKGWRIMGSVSTGFKSPSIFQLYDGFSGNRNLQAETSHNYEAGFMYQRNTGSVRATYFFRNIKNGIDYNYISNKYFNFIQQEVQGLEIEMSTPAWKGLSLTANYTYLDPKERTQNRITNKDTIQYSYLLRRPAHSLNATLGLEYKCFSAGLTGRFLGNRYDVGGFRKADVELPSYVILNARLGVRYNNRIRFFADTQNLLNKTFFDIRGFNSLPLTVNGGVTVTL